MAFENFKDQLKEQLSETWEKIQGSPAYNSLRERYETLPPPAQKGIIFGTVLFAAFMVLSIPYSYYTESTLYIENFDKDRDLMRSLLKASRLASEASAVPSAMDGGALKAQLQKEELNAFGLLTEQMGGVIDLDSGSMGGSMAPPTIRQRGVGVSLKQLNLTQVLEIGFSLQRLHPSVKMAGMEVTATMKDPHYFDVLYKLVTYSLPQMAAGGSAPGGPQGTGGNRGFQRPRPGPSPEPAEEPGGPAPEGSTDNFDDEDADE